MKKMICAMAALTMLATACKDKGEQFEINGRIAEADGKTLYFEAVTLNGIEALDSTRLDEDGQFCFQSVQSGILPPAYRPADRQLVRRLYGDHTRGSRTSRHGHRL